jgi:outer membrane receptor for ferrienterochelin and colicins
MTKKLRFIFLYVICLSLCCAKAIAGAPVDSTGHLKDTTLQFHDMVYTGTLKEMRKDDFAIPVEIYGQQYFLKNNVTNLYEAITMISGIQANIDGALDGSGDIEINGMDGPFTLTMIDGMPVSSGNAGVYSFAGIPIGMIDRIEIIKGPASTIYGSDAMAGVVNVITKNPEHISQFFGDVRATSYAETNAEIGAQIPAGRATGMVNVSTYNMNTRWDKNHDGYTDIPLTNRATIFSKWTFRNRYKKLCSIFGRYLYDNRSGGQMAYNKSYIGSDSIYGETARTNRYEVYGNFALPVEKVDMTLQASYTDQKQDAWYGTHPFFNEERNARIQFLYDNKTRNVSDLTMGASYRLYWYNDNLHNPADTNTGVLNKWPLINHFPAAFIQDMIHVNKNNEILAGIRYEYNTLYQGNAICPRFDYKWMDDKRSDIVRWSLGTGFKTPDIFIDDRYAYTNGKFIVINGDIKTEYCYGTQVDFERKIRKHGNFDIDANVFFNLIQNMIEADIFSRPDAVIYSNDGSLDVFYGLNVKTEMAFAFPLRATVAFTLLRNVQLSKNGNNQLVYDNVANAPNFTSTFTLSYAFRKAAVTIDLTGLINSPMYLNTVIDDYRPQQSPWYCIMNIQVTKKFKCGVDIYAGANNLLNFTPHNVLLNANDPFNRTLNNLDANPHNYTFNTSYIYAPNQGIKGFLGFRWHLDNLGKKKKEEGL